MSQAKKIVYADPSVTADVIVFTIEDQELKVLLIQRDDDPFAGTWALPGAFLREGESTSDAAERTLREKGGVRDIYVEQLYTFDDLKRDPRGQIISVSYLAIAPRDNLNIMPSKQTQNPTLYSVARLPKLAFDHRQIIDYAHSRLKSKLEYTNLAYSLLPRTFTFQDLQNVYEAILNQTLDKRNFRKKFMSLNLLESTGKYSSGQRHRPAELYRFKEHKPMELARWF